MSFGLGIRIGIGAQNAGNAEPPAPATVTVATTGDEGEIIFDPIVSLDEVTAATGDAGEIVITKVGGGSLEAFYREKTTETLFTRVTGTSPVTVSGLSEDTVFEVLNGDGDGSVSEVTSGAAAFIDPATVFFGAGENGFYIDATDTSILFQNTAGTTPAETDQDDVQRINDLSPNNNDFIQSTLSLSPKYETDGTRQWVKSDGTDDYMELPADNYTSSSGYFVAFAGRLPVLSNVDAIFSMDNAGSPRGDLLLRESGGVFRSLAFNTSQSVFEATSPAYTAGDWCVVTVNLSGGQLTVRLNGVAGTSTTVTGTPQDISKILRMFGEDRNDTVSEVDLTCGLVVSRPATAQEISDLEELFASKVGITLP